MDWINNKLAYRAYCQKETSVPVFMQDWWLDVVCKPEGWRVCISKDKGDTIQGVLPFRITTHCGFKVIRMPDLTPRMGIHYHYPQNLRSEKSIKRFERKVLVDLINQLPRVMYFSQKYTLSFRDWLPFQWAGFDQTTRYTYLISKELRPENIWESMDASVRNKIRKAEAYPLQVVSSEDIELFYQINQKSFDRQKAKMPYSLKFIKKLDQALNKQNQRKILFARDETEAIHAAIYLVWDETTVYNLMLGADSSLRSSGAVQLLLWSGIQKALKEGKTFDFEGGMIETIEPIFRAFGAELRPYHKISKAGSFFFRLLNSIRN